MIDITCTTHTYFLHVQYLVNTINLKHVFNRIKSRAASKYGLASQPRLVDIIAAVPASYKKVLRGVYMEEGQPSLLRSRISVKFFVKIYFRLYERRAIPPWRDLSIDYRDLA